MRTKLQILGTGKTDQAAKQCHQQSATRRELLATFYRARHANIYAARSSGASKLSWFGEFNRAPFRDLAPSGGRQP